ncbi:glutaminase [Kineococcus arenarius]|uniref:glutaminase n=1 Tax=Kineococcus sp. SYSU DK007 TaxID=3383128 RepID=UPI003D7E6718
MNRTADARHHDLDDLRERVRVERGGRRDDSTPQLAAADAELCALAPVLSDGTVRTGAQADVAVSVQSAVKPFLFALALLDTRGRALERIVRGLSAFAARDLDVDIADSEHLLGDRNHALAHLMRAEGTLRVGADDAVAVHARACAVLVDARVLAVRGATSASGGRNPVPGEQVVPPEVARDVVSIMATVISPPLDEQGTSVRGRIACEELSADLGLHVFGSRAL